jgi:hypothetical protein
MKSIKAVFFTFYPLSASFVDRKEKRRHRFPMTSIKKGFVCKANSGILIQDQQPLIDTKEARFGRAFSTRY